MKWRLKNLKSSKFMILFSRLSRQFLTFDGLTITYKYEYNGSGNHHVTNRLKQMIPGSNTTSKRYTASETLIYKDNVHRVGEQYYKKNNKQVYVGGYKYNGDGYLIAFNSEDDDFRYYYSYDQHGTIVSEGYDDDYTYYKYKNDYDQNGRLIKYTYADTNDQDYKGESVEISYKTIKVNSKDVKGTIIQQKYYLRNGKYYDEAQYNYLNDIADAYS